MALTLTISGIDRMTGYLVPGSLSVSRRKRGRASAGFELRDPAQLYQPARGNPVVIGDAGTVFSGLIDKVLSKRDDNLDSVRYIVSCQDYGAIFDRRTVARRYLAGMSVNTIVSDIVTNFLTGEGFTTTNVNGFVAIADDLDFDRRTVTECLDRLADLSGEDWWTEGKDLYLKSLALAPAAPFSITDSSNNWRDLEVDYAQARSYRNRQYVRTGVSLSSGSIQDNHTAAAGQIAFSTTFPLYAAPVVKVNTVSQTVYESGVDVSGQAGYYWVRGGTGVFRGDGVPPGAGASIEIIYGNYTSNVVYVQDTSEIAARAAIEGGSGIWEAVEEARDIQTLDVATAFAQAILNRYKTLPTSIKYSTYAGGLKPGMKQTVNLTPEGISADYYVAQIDSRTERAIDAFPTGYFLRNIVTLTSALDFGGSMKFWETFFNRTKAVGPTADSFASSGTGGSSSSSGSSLTPDFSSVAQVVFTMTGNTTVNAPTGVPAAGSTVKIVLVQDGTGGRTVTWNAAYRFPEVLAPKPDASKATIYVFTVSSGGNLVLASYLTGLTWP